MSCRPLVSENSNGTRCPLRVLHVASSYPRFTGDPTAPFMEEMLSRLAETGHAVRILVPRVDGLMEGVREGVEVVGVPHAPRALQVWGYGRSMDSSNRLRVAALLVTPFVLIAFALALSRELRAWKPDVVHLHWLLPLGMLALLVPSTIPVVVSAHGADVKFATGFLKVPARAVLRRANLLTAASSQSIHVVLSKHPDVGVPTVIIPHGADGDRFMPRDKREARLALGLDSERPIVLSVARLVEKKGLASFVRAAAIWRNSALDAFVAGEGPQMEGLVAQASTDGVRVTFLGGVNRDQMALWYGAADVVVIPSAPVDNDIDSGPVVLMEAFAAGRPVVSTRVGMAPTVIDHGINGFLVPSADPDAIAAATIAAVERSEDMGVAARETFDHWGDWRRVARDLDEAYVLIAGDVRVANDTTGPF